jgi:hypothetical protein
MATPIRKRVSLVTLTLGVKEAEVKTLKAPKTAKKKNNK